MRVQTKLRNKIHIYTFFLQIEQMWQQITMGFKNNIYVIVFAKRQFAFPKDLIPCVTFLNINMQHF